MEEEKKLYPFQFSRFDGNEGEEIHIADLGYQDSMVRNGWLTGNTISEIMDMYMDRVVGEDVFAYFGRQFPLLIKVLNPTGRTVLCVHPDDETAGQRYDFLGKKKLWYVMEAGASSRLFLGFRKDVTAEEFYTACGNGTAEGLLNVVTPKVGEHYLIHPGAVNAAENVKLLEIAESSPLDFQLFNWGKGMEGDEIDEGLTLEAAFDFIDYRKYCKCGHHHDECCGEHEGHCHCHEDEGHCHCHEEEITGKLADEQEFTVTKLNLTDPLHIYSGRFGNFIIYTCVAGRASVQVPATDEDGNERTDYYELECGDSILIPAETEDLFLVPASDSTILIESMVRKRDEPDPYIDPEAEEHHCDCDDHDDCGCGQHGNYICS